MKTGNWASYCISQELISTVHTLKKKLRQATIHTIILSFCLVQW